MEELNNYFVEITDPLRDCLRNDLVELIENAREYGVRSKEVQDCLTKTIQFYENEGFCEDYCVCAASLLLLMEHEISKIKKK